MVTSLVKFWSTIDLLDDATLVTVAGQVDMDSCCEVEDRLRQANEVPNPVVVDLGSVTFFGSSGVNALCSALESCDARGVALAILPSPAVVNVLKKAGVYELFNVIPAAPR
ncbi:MAG TPA: STAS domain-containing protein [Pseudonocardiaceae bacterium]|nr:STAS domain-containing protein [Pseudonocardiaceae bacterium]